MPMVLVSDGSALSKCEEKHEVFFIASNGKPQQMPLTDQNSSLPWRTYLFVAMY